MIKTRTMWSSQVQVKEESVVYWCRMASQCARQTDCSATQNTNTAALRESFSLPVGPYKGSTTTSLANNYSLKQTTNHLKAYGRKTFLVHRHVYNGSSWKWPNTWKWNKSMVGQMSLPTPFPESVAWKPWQIPRCTTTSSWCNYQHLTC